MLIRGMTYSIDLRQRVVDYVERGGSKVAAARVFNVSRGTIYNWFDRESLIPTKVIRRNRKLDWKRLREDVLIPIIKNNEYFYGTISAHDL